MASDESKFKPGDVVMLKSGGPSMVVEDVDDRVDCTWFHTEGKRGGELRRARLRAETIVIVNDGAQHPR